MKFRNATSDVLDVPALGVSIEPGDTTPELTTAEAEGFEQQADVWHAVGPKAKAAAAASHEADDTKGNGS